MYNELYRTDPQIALEGQVADTSPATIVSRTVVDAALGFGKAATTDGEHQVHPTTTGDAAVLGISIRSQATKAESPDQYPVGDTAAVMLKGAIWVKVAETVAPGDDVTVTVATGAFGTQAVAAGIVAIAGATYETGAAANGLARVRII